MKKIAILSSLLATCLVIAAQAQTPAPKPDPALQKYRVWLGHWKGVIEEQSGHKVPVEETFEMILGGFFMQDRIYWPDNGSHTLYIGGYDPTKKNYPGTEYDGRAGKINSWTFTVDDANIWTFASNEPFPSPDGKKYWMRIPTTFSADSMSREEKTEISEDGKTWTTVAEYKGTKIRPAAKN
jgi:hypothetical protein